MTDKFERYVQRTLVLLVSSFFILAIITAMSSAFRTEIPILNRLYSVITSLTPYLISITVTLTVVILTALFFFNPDRIWRRSNIQTRGEPKEPIHQIDLPTSEESVLHQLPPNVSDLFEEAIRSYESGAYTAAIVMSALSLEQSLKNWTGNDVTKQNDGYLGDVVGEDLSSDIDYVLSKRNVAVHGTGKITKQEAKVAIRTVAKVAKIFSTKQKKGESKSGSYWKENYGPEDVEIVFNTNTTDGENIFIDKVTLPEGGFVVVIESPLEELSKDIVGTSEYLEPGTHEEVVVELDVTIEDSQQLSAFLWEDTNNNGELDLVGENVDKPYTDEGILYSDQTIVQINDEVR